ncbi:SIMPL domain-containing protein, partial [Candidatus Uhrbacteria bacterium]|nr:SIMPL domain-containing protein [Candidatus Uhrbacteria bacterium]
MSNGESFWPTWRTNRLFTLLLALAFAYLITWLASLVWLNTLKAARVGEADEQPHTIAIEGVGKVTATPNIATATLGLQTTKADVPSAQRENTEKMNRFIDELKRLSIAAEDIQTVAYSIYPQYRYDNETNRSVIDAYVVSQSVQVKIRDLTKISTVLGAAGEAGMNQVSGVSFTIDDPEVLEAEARQEALALAQVKARELARALGVRLGEVVGFTELGGLPPTFPPPYYLRAEIGGGGEAPNIESGSL